MNSLIVASWILRAAMRQAARRRRQWAVSVVFGVALLASPLRPDAPARAQGGDGSEFSGLPSPAAKPADATEKRDMVWISPPTPIGRTNLLRNGNFVHGSENWKPYYDPAGARQRLECRTNIAVRPGYMGRVMRNIIEKTDGHPGSVQYMQDGLELAEGENYTLAFDVKADHARKITVVVENGRNDLAVISGSFAVERAWTRRRMTFRATGSAETRYRIMFLLGGDTGFVDLAALALRPGGTGADARNQAGSRTARTAARSAESATTPISTAPEGPGAAVRVHRRGEWTLPDILIALTIVCACACAIYWVTLTGLTSVALQTLGNRIGIGQRRPTFADMDGGYRQEESAYPAPAAVAAARSRVRGGDARPGATLTGPRLVGLAGIYEGDVFFIEELTVNIGRQGNNGIALPRDTAMSRYHATIREVNSQFVLIDRDSCNGTFVNGVRVVSGQPQPLRPGDELDLGKTRFRFEV